MMLTKIFFEKKIVRKKSLRLCLVGHCQYNNVTVATQHHSFVVGTVKINIELSKKKSATKSVTIFFQQDFYQYKFCLTKFAFLTIISNNFFSDKNLSSIYHRHIEHFFTFLAGNTVFSLVSESPR